MAMDIMEAAEVAEEGAEGAEGPGGAVRRGRGARPRGELGQKFGVGKSDVWKF